MSDTSVSEIQPAADIEHAIDEHAERTGSVEYVSDEDQSADDEDADEHINLLRELCAPSASEAEPPSGHLPSPTVNGQLASAVHAWLEAHETSAAEIPSAKALVLSAGLKDPGGFRKRLDLFRKSAGFLGMPQEQLPTARDLRLARNPPRVYTAIAFIARAVDNDAWEAMLADAGTVHPTSWFDAMEEWSWEGDFVIRHLVRCFGDCTLVVAGTQGAGKSAVIDTLLGLRAIPHSHALGYHPSRESSRVAKLRHLAAINWPTIPFERNLPEASDQIDSVHVKVDGRVVSFLELPSMELSVEGMDPSGGIVTVELSNFRSVVQQMQGERPNVVLFVERLDQIDEKRTKKALDKVHGLFGPEMFQRLVILLTHGQSLPPDDLSYDVWSFQQVQRVLAAAHRIGKKLPVPPVVIVENSENCAANDHGRYILPNGTDFVDQFMSEVGKIADSVEPNTELRPMPAQRWWEKYVIMLAISFILFRIR